MASSCSPDVASGFTGRQGELDRLTQSLDAVRQEKRAGIVLVTGPRLVGKSRLVTEFLHRAALPHVYFTAGGGRPADALAAFAAEVRASTLPAAGRTPPRGTPPGWEMALIGLAGLLPADTPSAVVLDEVPALVRRDPGFGPALRQAVDVLSRLPVLLVLIGADAEVMAALGRQIDPLGSRVPTVPVRPWNPAQIAARLGLPAAEAIDAYLVSGGLPPVLAEWPHGAGVWDHLPHALHPRSALLVSGERACAAEWPAVVQPRTVLAAIGQGKTSFTEIGRASGGLHPGSLFKALDPLVSRRLVRAELPLSARISRETRYRVEDPYLHLWLAFLRPSIPAVERGRADLALAAVRDGWNAWRRRALVPVVRDALLRLGEDRLPGETAAVGGYWTRSRSGVDLVGADRMLPARRITFLGSVKWAEDTPFDAGDLACLNHGRGYVPGAGASTSLFAVSRSGCTASGVTCLEPEDLVHAWAAHPEPATPTP
ncbi:AAA family ATPase [Streptomyces lycii]|uniref:AAA family ATPase n=1 Tax=Streptomyces lycii TaxID=2654337 RepID=UPI001F1AEEF6|nr:ATP-binding protein [Streptomyces lycii]